MSTPNDPAAAAKQPIAALAEAVRDFRHNIERSHINNGALVSGDASYKALGTALAAYEEAVKQITYVGVSPPSERDGDKFQIENLAVLVMRLCALLPPDKQARVAALDYLQRHKLTPSPLREQIEAAKAVPAKPKTLLEAVLVDIANSCSINGDPDDAADTLQWIENRAREALAGKNAPKEPAKPGDWMREAAADIIELTLDHPPKTSEELVKLLDTGAKVIAELCPAQPKRDLQPIVDDLRTLVCRLVRLFNKKPFQSDLPQKAMEYLVKNDLLGEPLRGSIPENEEERDAYDKLVKAIFPEAQPKREISARELIEELEKRHIKTFSNQVLTELEAERAKAGQQIKREVSARDVPLEEVISLLVSAGTWIRRIEERHPELSKHYPAFLDNIGEEEIRKFRKNIFAMCDFLERARADTGGAT